MDRKSSTKRLLLIVIVVLLSVEPIRAQFDLFGFARPIVQSAASAVGSFTNRVQGFFGGGNGNDADDSDGDGNAGQPLIRPTRRPPMVAAAASDDAVATIAHVGGSVGGDFGRYKKLVDKLVEQSI